MADIDTLSELVSIEQLADRLGITVRHVRRLVADKRIPYLKAGKLVRFALTRSPRGSSATAGQRPIVTAALEPLRLFPAEDVTPPRGVRLEAPAESTRSRATMTLPVPPGS
jgi:excisionase family DNA binding protein